MNLHIGSDRQLLFDDLWMEDSEDVTRRLHSPVRREIAIAAENPWEQGGVSYMVAEAEQEGYRAWYRCDCEMPPTDRRQPLIAHARSVDGIHWEKDPVGLLEFEGSTANNLIWTGPGNNLSPFRDDAPDIPADERYKGIVRAKQVYALASPDGFHWKHLQDEPILREQPFDSHNIAFRDPWTGKYVIYARGVGGRGDVKGGVRWIRRFLSDDFRNWDEGQLIDVGFEPDEHLYTNACVPYERAPGTYLMFPSRFVNEREPIPDWEYGPGVNDITFLASRDGLHFDYSFREAFVRPGPDPDNWHERAIYMERGILQTSPTEISMFGMENWRMPGVCIRRYSLRTDGFVSVNAGFAGGTFTTPVFTFEGDQLEVNYSTSAVGAIGIELQQADGTPIPGRTLVDAGDVYGDEVDGVYAWNGASDVTAWAGKPVRMQVALKDADLFAFRFRRHRRHPGA
ncbi:MAG: hypothetical protein QGG05_07590 [Candidatus Latescibacteria bacterium]|nr:hypothetical protein [Candidatus Latescibacterota bacterium]